MSALKVPWVELCLPVSLYFLSCQASVSQSLISKAATEFSKCHQEVATPKDIRSSSCPLD